MKKTTMLASFFIASMALLPLISTAKINHKEPKATDIKIHKKQLISEEERKSFENAASKGNAGDKGSKSRVFKPLATGKLGQSLPEGGKRFAIVAGLANYSGTANDLCVAAAETELADPTTADGLAYYCRDKDSFNMKEALLSQGFLEENITHLHDFQATRQGITDAMDDLKAKVGSSDEVVFFFSGHGTSGKLISLTDRETIDEAIFTYDNNYIWDDELKIWADSLNVNRMVFAFDICLAGGMNELAGANRVVVMSSAETQSSWTYSVGGMLVGGVPQESEGLFSHYFVKDGTIDGLADGSNLLSIQDGKVAMEEAFSYAYPIVKIKQAPVLSDKFADDLLLGY